MLRALLLSKWLLEAENILKWFCLNRSTRITQWFVLLHHNCIKPNDNNITQNTYFLHEKTVVLFSNEIFPGTFWHVFIHVCETSWKSVEFVFSLRFKDPENVSKSNLQSMVLRLFNNLVLNSSRNCLGRVLYSPWLHQLFGHSSIHSVVLESSGISVSCPELFILNMLKRVFLWLHFPTAKTTKVQTE